MSTESRMQLSFESLQTFIRSISESLAVPRRLSLIASRRAEVMSVYMRMDSRPTFLSFCVMLTGEISSGVRTILLSVGIRTATGPAAGVVNFAICPEFSGPKMKLVSNGISTPSTSFCGVSEAWENLAVLSTSMETKITVGVALTTT